MIDREQRAYALAAWVGEQLNELFPHLSEAFAELDLVCVAGDASFRRYFRVALAGGQSWICVDAPPDKEDSGAFVRVAELLGRYDILVPKVMSFDLEAGFMLLSDFGNQLFLDQLNDSVQQNHYHMALDLLLKMQQLPVSELQFLPKYDAHSLQAEMDLFQAWFLPEYLQLSLDKDEIAVLNNVYELLINSAIEQPQVFVHRDYHSRNLMWVREQVLGTIDFQDAVLGPVTYDLVSLLRDCYFRLPKDQLLSFLTRHAKGLEAVGVLQAYDCEQWLRWFDWIGLQRHIKVCGIFSRLNFRDGKAGYLKDIPLTVRYLIEVASQYQEMKTFANFLIEKVRPKLYQVNPQAKAIIENS